MNDKQKLPLPPSRPHFIQSEAEALRVADELAAEFRQTAAQRDRERLLPWDEIERYTASGLGAITVPKAFGGLGASYETLARVFTTICAADASLGQIPQNHFAIVQNLQDYASAAQQQRWFADVLNGHRFGNAGPERKAKAKLTTDATAAVTRDDDGRLRVSGTRFYSTGAIFAHWIPFRALDKTQGGADKPVQVWVRRNAPGVRVIDDWDAFGQKTTASGSVIFENVLVQEEDIVPLWQQADKATLSGPVSQLIQASIDAGIAQEALRDAIAFVQEKSRPWVDSGVEKASLDPHLIQEVGQLQIEVDAAFEVLIETAQTLDEIRREPVTAESSARASVAIAEAKILTTEAALEAGEHLFALAGSAATRAAHNLDRHWRNARVQTVHDPVRWKYHLLGNYLLNGVAPKRHQWN
jgi:SfnB family sulfur acquisition oxidoreductase